MIKAINITKSFGDVHVLHGVSFEVAPGQVAAIMGQSGAGKSTLLHIVGTLEKADRGKVLIDGVDLSTLSEKKLAQVRNQSLGFIFQFHHLLPEFTALENVCIPAYIANVSKAEAEKRAKELLGHLGLSHRLTHKPKEMSGGEQQRVAFARALINHPRIILADEPTGNLDEKTAGELHQLILQFRRDFNLTFVIVTHNPQLAELCDQVLYMDKGKVVPE